MRAWAADLSLFVTQAVFWALLSLVLVPAKAQTTADRTAYVRSTYSALNHLVPTLASSEAIEDQDTLEFLKAVALILKQSKPELIFVNDNAQFVMNSEEAPRLMRAPDDPLQPIFVNQELLNSERFQLDLPQLIKLLLHELGHKTQMRDVPARDQWAQRIEDLIRGHTFQSPQESGSFVEALSLPVDLIQIPIEKDPYTLQPTFLVFLHTSSGISDLTPELYRHINENTLLTRSIGTEILTLTTELANAFTEIMRTHVAPVLDQFTMMFSSPGEEAPSFGNSLDKMEGPIKAMTLVELKRAGLFQDEVVFDASLVFARSHIKKGTFNANGFPWHDVETFPVQIKIGRRSSIQLMPEPNYSEPARVGQIIRESGRLKTIDVSFSHSEFPYAVELGLEYSGGTLRLSATNRENLGNGRYRARFEFSSPDFRYSQYAEKIFIDNDEVQFLNRRVEINDDAEVGNLQALTPDEINPESVGIWGFRGQRWSLEREFSHLNRAYLFFVPSAEEKSFVINPYNMLIEFEIRSDIGIRQVELFWTLEQMILNTSETETPPFEINEKTEHGEVRQRYAVGGGNLVEQKILRESILFDRESIQELSSSRPGFKTVRLKGLTPMKHLRPLRESHEAHKIPSVAPLSLKITTTDMRTYHHMFASADNREEIERGIRESCRELIRAAGRAQGR